MGGASFKVGNDLPLFIGNEAKEAIAFVSVKARVKMASVQTNHLPTIGNQLSESAARYRSLFYSDWSLVSRRGHSIDKATPVGR